MRRYFLLMSSAMFFVICLSLYMMLQSAPSAHSDIREHDLEQNDLNGIESKIRRIEAELVRNHKTIQLLKDTVRDLAQGDVSSLDKLQQMLKKHENGERQNVVHMQQKPILAPKPERSIIKDLTLPQNMCGISPLEPVKPNEQMFDVFNNLAFDDKDGGVWKQGYPITYDAKNFEEKKLEVVVIPHSHCDPGWIKTLDRYYSEQVQHILDNAVAKLEQFPKMRFIYAEVSFFSMWWAKSTKDTQRRAKALIDDGRLEIVTGGWVMTDEANAHYFAMLDQMIEGNQWLLNEVGVKPRNGWAIDPFGHSPTMPYLLKRMGFQNMLIQRTHYAIKKHLSLQRHLEFRWRQTWDHGESTDMFCHMMPFYSYDVPHTCGPDPKICCQFDFKRLPGGRVNCPWGIPPQPINKANVAVRAQMLLDQYRKKTQLYLNNVLLVPLGDDFRYDRAEEWDNQYNNYQQLFDYMNGVPEWNVNARFGTLNDYFDLLHKRAGVKADQPPAYPTLSGDFFTYADRQDHYWSGYFTSRPFYKRLDRVVEEHLRGAEIIYSLAVAEARKTNIRAFPEAVLMRSLTKARRSLGLFQHHDGITGTAKDHVVVDYGMRLLRAINDLKGVVINSAHLLALEDKRSFKYDETRLVFDVDDTRLHHDSLPMQTTIVLNEKHARSVFFYNSLASKRTQLVRLKLSSPDIEISGPNNEPITAQVMPAWTADNLMSSEGCKVAFVVEVPALGLARYSLIQKENSQSRSLSDVIVYNSQGALNPAGPHKAEAKVAEKFSLANEEMALNFDLTGLLESSGETIDAKIEFVKYGVASKKEKSGAYLFLPDGEGRPIYPFQPLIRVVRGPLLSEVMVKIEQTEHFVRLRNTPGLDALAVEIYNLVDVTKFSNQELAMRIKTGIENANNEFYTDLNGFQIIKRKWHQKLPLQANYYPMPSMAFIEDKKHRFSVLSAQSLGCASLKTGWIEVMQDRRLNQDDNRGVGQGVLDNKQTPNLFTLLFEPVTQADKRPASQPTGFASATAHRLSLQQLHPLRALPDSLSQDLKWSNSYSAMRDPFPCDLHLVNLRTMADDRETAALLLHRLGFDCSLPARRLQCSTSHQPALSELFQPVTVTSATATSLSLIHDSGSIEVNAPLDVPPMEIAAYKVKLK